MCEPGPESQGTQVTPVATKRVAIPPFGTPGRRFCTEFQGGGGRQEGPAPLFDFCQPSWTPAMPFVILDNFSKFRPSFAPYLGFHGGPRAPSLGRQILADNLKKLGRDERDMLGVAQNTVDLVE